MFSTKTGKEIYYANTPKAEPNPAGTIWQRRDKPSENAPKLNPKVFRSSEINDELQSLNNQLFELFINIDIARKSLDINNLQDRIKIKSLEDEYKKNKKNLLNKQQKLRNEFVELRIQDLNTQLPSVQKQLSNIEDKLSEMVKQQPSSIDKQELLLIQRSLSNIITQELPYIERKLADLAFIQKKLAEAEKGTKQNESKTTSNNNWTQTISAQATASNQQTRN